MVTMRFLSFVRGRTINVIVPQKIRVPSIVSCRGFLSISLLLFINYDVSPIMNYVISEQCTIHLYSSVRVPPHFLSWKRSSIKITLYSCCSNHTIVARNVFQKNSRLHSMCVSEFWTQKMREFDSYWRIVNGIRVGT